MAIKRSSEVKTWRDTPTGAQYFLAQEIEARLHETVLLAAKDEIPNRQMIELVLMQLRVMLHSPNPGNADKVKRVLRIEIVPPER